MTYLALYIVPIPESTSMGCCTFCGAEGTSEEFICFFSLLMFGQLFLFHCSLSCSISKLSHCRWLVEFDTIGEHVYNFKLFLVRFLVWHGAMCQVCFLPLWDTPVMTYFALYVVPIPESTSMDAARFVEQKGHLRSSIRLFSRLLFGENSFYFTCSGEFVWFWYFSCCSTLGEFDTTCKPVWIFKCEYFFFKISGSVFGLFL